MKRYCIVETKGNPIPMVAPCSVDEAKELCGTMDEHWPQCGPHRVVYLIEHTDAIETLIREAIANVDSVTSRDLRDAILAVKEEVGVVTAHAKCPKCKGDAALESSGVGYWCECGAKDHWYGSAESTAEEAWLAWDTIVGAYWREKEKNDGKKEG